LQVTPEIPFPLIGPASLPFQFSSNSHSYTLALYVTSLQQVFLVSSNRSTHIESFSVCLRRFPILCMAKGTLASLRHLSLPVFLLQTSSFRKNNQLDASISNIYFCHKTLHVSGIFCAHHQGLSTAHTANGTLHAGYVTAS
jgi:hypothetical protein